MKAKVSGRTQPKVGWREAPGGSHCPYSLPPAFTKARLSFSGSHIRLPGRLGALSFGRKFPRWGDSGSLRGHLPSPIPVGRSPTSGCHSGPQPPHTLAVTPEEDMATGELQWGLWGWGGAPVQTAPMSSGFKRTAEPRSMGTGGL